MIKVLRGGNKMRVADITQYDRFSYQSLYGSNQQSSKNTVIRLTPENKTNDKVPFNITTIKFGDNIINLDKGDTLNISTEAIEKLAASKNNDVNITPISLPTSYGEFNEDGGNFSTSAPVNFFHTSFAGLSSQDDFVELGIINQDYVSQFNSILKDSKGNLKSGDNILLATLNKYAELKTSISNSNLPDAESQIRQLENSLNWSVGTSLNKFANDMTQSNTWGVKGPNYTAKNNECSMVYSDGTKAYDTIFSVVNSSYRTACNIVFSAAKIIEKGIDYINNNQYDPKNSEDASKLVLAMNNGTNDADSANLSLSTLTDVISTFRDFVSSPDQVVLKNADNLAKNAPSSDIATVYTNIKNILILFPLSPFYGEKI